jgi:NADH-quinone oxidoreductase subunit G
LGSNLFGHVLRGKLMRVVARRNDAINETWISDRDRFSYEGIYSDDRLLSPMLRDANGWKSVDWQTALDVVARGLKAAPVDSLGFLASASGTLEEQTLFARLARGLGCANVDHRLRQADFSAAAVQPSLGMKVAAVDDLQALLVIGSNLRHELPMLANRVRKAAVRGGAAVSFINPVAYEYLFPVANNWAVSPAQQLAELASLVTAAQSGVAGAHEAVIVEQRHLDVVASLRGAERKAIWLGALAIRHPAYAALHTLASQLAAATGASLGVLAEGANAAGAHLAGVLPGRTAGDGTGLDAAAMLAKPLQSYVLLGVEPGADSVSTSAHASLAASTFVVALTPYASEELKAVAHVLLPIGTFAETSGTFVSLDGTWQSFAGAAVPVGEARPGWKVLRVLGNLLGLTGFDQNTSETVRSEVPNAAPQTTVVPATLASLPQVAADAQVVDVPLYRIDAIVRRASSLQATRDGQAGFPVQAVQEAS